MANIFSIKFVDIAKREELEQQRLDNDCENLEARKKKLGGELSDADQTELRRLTEIRKLNPPYVDPLFVSARAELKSDSTGLLPVVVDHEADGTLKFPDIPDDEKELRNAETARAALILGLLQLNKARMPTIKVAGREVVIDESHPNAPSFREAIFQAIGKAAGRLDLARKSLELLAGAVDVGNGQRGISTLDYARVFTRLVD